MIGELSKYGVANIRRAYGDWASDGLKNWKNGLHEYAIRPVQQFSYSAGKNASDMAMVIDAMELLYTQQLDAFCISLQRRGLHSAGHAAALQRARSLRLRRAQDSRAVR